MQDRAADLASSHAAGLSLLGQPAFLAPRGTRTDFCGWKSYVPSLAHCKDSTLKARVAFLQLSGEKGEIRGGNQGSRSDLERWPQGLTLQGHWP